MGGIVMSLRRFDLDCNTKEACVMLEGSSDTVNVS